MDDRDLNYPSASNHSREILPNKYKIIKQQDNPVNNSGPYENANKRNHEVAAPTSTSGRNGLVYSPYAV